MVTLDPYYTIDEYNRFLNSLENNGVKFSKYILAKPPYHIYLDIPDPFIVDYDKLPNNLEKLLINLTEPATPSDSYLLQRKLTNDGIKGLHLLAGNPITNLVNNSSYACFFHVRNREQALQLSREIGDIYYFGFYYNKFKICLTTNEYIKLTDAKILIEKETSFTQMELDLNFKIFKLNDRLKKYTETPFIRDGKYYPTKIQKFNHLI